MYYAQINDDGICIGVSRLSGAVEDAHMIELDSYDMSRLGQRWTGTAWEDVPAPTPDPQPEPVTLDQVYEQNLDIMDGLATLYEMQAGGAE